MLSRAHTLAAVLLLYLVCSGHNGGCHPDEGELLPSGVQALGVVLERPDGSLDARLRLVSNAVLPEDFVAASAAVLHTPGGEVVALQEVEPGRYQLADQDAAVLAYEAGDYLFAFSVHPDEARAKHVFGGDFVMAMHGAVEVPRVELVDSGDSEQLLTVRWQPEAAPALIELHDEAGALRISNLVREPNVAALPAWSALQATGQAELAAADLAAGETHLVRVCSVEVARWTSMPAVHALHQSGSSAGQLGSASGMLVGRCADVPWQ
jgi:hypothetical protein